MKFDIDLMWDLWARAERPEVVDVDAVLATVLESTSGPGLKELARRTLPA